MNDMNGQEWFRGFCDRKRAQFGEQFDPCNLTAAAQFIPHIAHAPRRRVQVEFSYGEKVWGYVGVTTGWRPQFLLLRRVGQRGSSMLLTAADRIIAQKEK